MLTKILLLLLTSGIIGFLSYKKKIRLDTTVFLGLITIFIGLGFFFPEWTKTLLVYSAVIFSFTLFFENKIKLDSLFFSLLISFLVGMGFTFSLYEEIFLAFSVVTAALFLFITEKVPVDITAFLILITLIFLGIFYPHAFPSISEGLSGLGNPATMTVLAMFILSAGIQKTGIIHILGQRVFSFVGNSEIKQLLAIGVLVAPISGFINNTAAVAIMLPMILDMAKRSGTAATKLLIPLSFFGMLGGTLTLIGTSTNILANSILRESENFSRNIGIFEFTHLGIIVLFVGFIYFLTIGRYLLPDRKAEQREEEDELFLTEVVIEKGCNLIGKTLEESKFGSKNDVKVMKIIREGKSFIKDVKKKKIEEGDILVIRADEQRIMDLNKKEGIKLLPDFDEEMRKRPAGTGKIVKIILRSANIFHNRSLDEIDFWKKFGTTVVGIRREEINARRLGNLKLQIGEILLVQASMSSLQKLKNSDDFLVLETIEEEYDSTKMHIALGIVASVVIIAAVTNVPIVVSALLGVVAMVLTGCIGKKDMYNSVSWDVIFLLAGVIPLGIAMQKSGAAELLASGIVSLADGFPAILVLALFYLVTTVLTEMVSNNASVALLIPIAISVAEKLHMTDPFPFILTVMFAASTSFLTPVGYQTNTMVYGSGNYKFSDFIKVGAPLNLILLVITTIGIYFFWPFQIS